MQRAEEIRYDNINNEGADGYNPYRDQRLAAENKTARIRTRDDILREIEKLDCSIARESGTYDAEKISALRKEIDEIEAHEENEFRAEWTPEVTAARREESNAWARSQKRKLRATDIAREEKRRGYTFADLEKAIAINK